MDSRKALLLTGGLLCGLAGCTKTVATPGTLPPPALSKVVAPASPSPDAIVTKRDSLGDPKPDTLVQLAALRAVLAADTNRSQAERVSLAQQAKDAYGMALKTDPKYAPAHLGLGNLREAL